MISDCGLRIADRRRSGLVSNPQSAIGNPQFFLSLALLVGAASLGNRTLGADDLVEREERALQAAVERVAPSVVSIDTVGGLERVEGVLFGSGPTTGLIVSADGYIVSSAFNFAQKPASILVGLADGSRHPAQLIATDRNRMLVLLKISTNSPLPVPEAAPDDEVQVGWWAIAVGRTFDGSRVNVSVGIVSALDRVWGKALQTDAKISPGNYGGPLVDIRGRVLGVLSPLSPQKTDEVSGVEWYDSGIGFAIPLTHVDEVLPRFKEGRDLLPGYMGVNLQGNLFADEAVIRTCRPNSPAYKAGLKAGDKIVEIDGRPIVRQAQLMQEIHRRYAGDTLRVAVVRGQERIEHELELVDHLDPFQRPFLGILPLREVPAGASGVAVRFVYPDSPAAKIGLEPGDRIVGLSGKPVGSLTDLVELSQALEFGQKTPLEFTRAGEKQQALVTWSSEPAGVPAELPPALGAVPPREGEAPAAQELTVKVPEFANQAIFYVPAGYDARLPCGLVVWLEPPGEFNREQVLGRWRAACDRHGLILLAPQPVDAARWQKSDLDFVHKAIDQLRASHAIDPLRIVAGGREVGGAVAYALAFSQRDPIRGVIGIDAPLGGRPPENDPAYRLDFLITTAAKSQHAGQIKLLLKLLEAQKFAVTVQDQGEAARAPTEAEQAEQLRWIDSLDKL